MSEAGACGIVIFIGIEHPPFGSVNEVGMVIGIGVLEMRTEYVYNAV